MDEISSLGINPSAYESKPEYSFWMHEFVEAFDVLSSRRSSGLFPNPIPLSEIILYDRTFPVSYDTDVFVKCIIMMDSAFLEFVVKDKQFKGSE